MDYDALVVSIFRYTNIKLDASLSTSPISFRRIFPCFNLIYRTLEMEDTDALYVPTTAANYVYVNPLRPYVRRRFSVGHEFGHYYLQHPYSVGLPKEHMWEVQANKFSAALLMPVELVWRVNKYCDSISEIARWFRVSRITAAIRLQNLGLRADECESVIRDYWDEQGDPVLYVSNSWGWDM